jgi:hypothetical protein
MELKSAELPNSTNPTAHHGARIILRLTYVSRYNVNNANIEIARILEQAQRNNKRDGITGVLIINDNFFLQSIEGARPVINQLLRDLVKDDRHFALQIVDCHEVAERRWNQWSMKYLMPNELDKEQILKFSASEEFNPYQMSNEQIMLFIENLSKLEEQRASENEPL